MNGRTWADRYPAEGLWTPRSLPNERSWIPILRHLEAKNLKILAKITFGKLGKGATLWPRRIKDRSTKIQNYRRDMKIFLCGHVNFYQNIADPILILNSKILNPKLTFEISKICKTLKICEKSFFFIKGPFNHLFSTHPFIVVYKP